MTSPSSPCVLLLKHNVSRFALNPQIRYTTRDNYCGNQIGRLFNDKQEVVSTSLAGRLNKRFPPLAGVVAASLAEEKGRNTYYETGISQPTTVAAMAFVYVL